MNIHPHPTYTLSWNTQMHSNAHAYTCIAMHKHIALHTQSCIYTHTQTHACTKSRCINRHEHTNTHIHRYAHMQILNYNVSIKNHQINTFCQITIEEICTIINCTIPYIFMHFSTTLYLLTIIFQIILNKFLSNTFLLCVRCSSATYFKLCNLDEQKMLC